jgi:hypothetical protein
MAVDRKPDFTTKYRRQILWGALIALLVAGLAGFVQVRNAEMDRDRAESYSMTITTLVTPTA